MVEFGRRLLDFIVPNSNETHHIRGEVYGKFHDGAPWVPIRVDFGEKRLNKPLWVWFLIDTGAGVSVLINDDATALGIEKPEKFSSGETVVNSSLNSACKYFEVQAHLSFKTTHNELISLEHRLLIPVKEENGPGITLLGRDVLKNFTLAIGDAHGEVCLMPNGSAPFSVTLLKEQKIVSQ